MSSKAGKRPLRSLTAHEKLEAIRRVHDGESKASVARDIGVPESTLRGWCKNEDKISYLSRQSSPETDESAMGAEIKEKKPKLDELLQPYNLSKKTNGGTHSPVTDFSKNEFDINSSKPLNLNVKTTESFKTSPAMSERERNRAELARLSVELGLNRPEMFLPNTNSGSSIADLTSNIGLLAQWNSLIANHQQKPKTSAKITAPADTSSSSVAPFSVMATPTKLEAEPKHKTPKLPKVEKPSTLDESVWYWLKTQPSMLGLMQNQNGLPVSSTSTTPTVTSSTTYNDAAVDQSSSWFWKWYKQFANSYPLQQQLPDKPILYQQLTKNKDHFNTENIIDDKYQLKNNTKARAVLDNLLFNNNNNNLGPVKREDKSEILTQSEALEHGEKFLEWLECCSEPSVTTMQIMQFSVIPTFMSVLLATVSCEKRDEREPSIVANETFPIKLNAGQCLMTTFFFGCSELPFVDFEELCCSNGRAAFHEFHRENYFLVPEHSSRTFYNGESSLELIWFTQGMRIQLLFRLLFYFFIFDMNQCLVPCDNLVQRSPSSLKRLQFSVFSDDRTASWEPILSTVFGAKVSYSRWYRELTLKFQETNHSSKHGKQNPVYLNTVNLDMFVIFLNLVGFIHELSEDDFDRRYWPDKNPRWMMEYHTLYHHKVNVWCGIVDGRIPSPYFLTLT
ncbi:hypothetical protein FQA39_LY03312 [Lamprigera yunnana]|nr:hypothetical protein FQA39_LY03312 [Lamprigera yunnana]